MLHIISYAKVIKEYRDELLEKVTELAQFEIIVFDGTKGSFGGSVVDTVLPKGNSDVKITALVDYLTDKNMADKEDGGYDAPKQIVALRNEIFDRVVLEQDIKIFEQRKLAKEALRKEKLAAKAKKDAKPKK